MDKINVASIMIPKVCTVFLHEKNTVRQGLEIMTRYGYTCVPVLDQEEHYVGCISEGDFLRHMLATGSTDKKFHEQFHLNEIMRKESSPALHIQADAAEMLLAIMNQNFLPVVDDRNFLCGIVTRRSVITELSRRLTNS